MRENYNWPFTTKNYPYKNLLRIESLRNITTLPISVLNLLPNVQKILNILLRLLSYLNLVLFEPLINIRGFNIVAKNKMQQPLEQRFIYPMISFHSFVFC